jgi:hypothetical protein
MGYQYRGKIRDVEQLHELPAPAPKPKPVRVLDKSKCGTRAGYAQHARLGTKRCRPCLDAHNEYKREWLANKRNHIPLKRAEFNPNKCGTYAGYVAHLRYKITPCVPCKIAHSKYMAEYREKRKQAAEIDVESAA